MEFFFGVIVAAALCGLAIVYLVPEKADRTRLLQLIFKRFFAAPEPEVEVVPPPPPPPVAPPLKFGNILRVESELDDPDVSACFVFPEKVAPTLAYDDFNRRLVVFTVKAAGNGPTPLFPTRISDEPIRVAGSPEYLWRLIRTQFRPAYPVLVDGAGLFAAQSTLIEQTPLHRPPIVSAVLNLAEQDRPVIFSLVNNAPATAETFTFLRYGFEDFRFDPGFLGQDWSKSLPKTLEHFLGPADQWMYFSRARLRHALMLLDEKSAKIARELAEEVEAKRVRDAQEEEERENDVRFDSFSHLFKLTPTENPEPLQ